MRIKKYFSRKTQIIYSFIPYIFLLILLLPTFLCNSIKFKFHGTGEDQTFINIIDEKNNPDIIIIDDEILPFSTYHCRFKNKIVTIEMKWKKNDINFYRMFANISNLIEIDLSKFNTSLVTDMSYMFENCKSLIFANLSNINTSSLVNIEYMFSNCISLISLDLTNFDIYKIKNNKNIFLYCTQLNKNNFVKRTLEENEFCNNIDNIFDENRTCKIDLNTLDKIINQSLIGKNISFIKKN